MYAHTFVGCAGGTTWVWCSVMAGGTERSTEGFMETDEPLVAKLLPPTGPDDNDDGGE